MSNSEQTQDEVFEAVRKVRVESIVRLWKQKTGKDVKALDAAINKRFEVQGGRDALTFDSMDVIEAGLNKL